MFYLSIYQVARIKTLFRFVNYASHNRVAFIVHKLQGSILPNRNIPCFYFILYLILTSFF